VRWAAAIGTLTLLLATQAAAQDELLVRENPLPAIFTQDRTDPFLDTRRAVFAYTVTFPVGFGDIPTVDDNTDVNVRAIGETNSEYFTDERDETNLGTFSPGEEIELSLSAEDFNPAVFNETISFTLEFSGEEGEQLASRNVTLAIDTLAPPPVAELAVMPRDSGVELFWDNEPYVTLRDRSELPRSERQLPATFLRYEDNVQFFRVYAWEVTVSPPPVMTTVTEAIGLPAANQPADIMIEHVRAPRIEIAADFRYVVDGLPNESEIGVLVEAIDHAGNRSGVLVDADGRPDFASSTPLASLNFSEAGDLDDKCFVVTAAFGDAQSEWVNVYRYFRDRILARTELGRDLIQVYYRYGPGWATWLEAHPIARHAARWGFVFAAPLVLVAAAFPWLLVAAAGAWLLRLRGRRRQARQLGAMCVALAAFWPQAATAFENQMLTVRTNPTEFNDAVVTDSDTGQQLDYESIYGDTGTFRISVDYTWFPWELFGQWGIETSVGIALDNGEAVARTSDGERLQGSSEDTRFLFAPMSLRGRYRGLLFDRQPLVPSVYAGLDFWPWRETRSSGGTTRNFVSRWNVGGELELILDFLEPSSEVYMRERYGIVDSAIFFGWQYTKLDDFGNTNTADFSHHGWTAGLRFLF